MPAPPDAAGPRLRHPLASQPWRRSSWAPRLYQDLDQIFDADLESGSSPDASPRSPSAVRGPPVDHALRAPVGAPCAKLLRWLRSSPGRRLSAGLLCAMAEAAVRLPHPAGAPGRAGTRARAFGLRCPPRLVFSSSPGHAFCADLVLVYVIALPRGARSRPGWRPVLSFGVTATGLVAVALTHLDWRRDVDEPPRPFAPSGSSFSSRRGSPSCSGRVRRPRHSSSRGRSARLLSVVRPSFTISPSAGRIPT
jgi:hypothetical protein